jgi:hypothetical protein
VMTFVVGVGADFGVVVVVVVGVGVCWVVVVVVVGVVDVWTIGVVDCPHPAITSKLITQRKRVVFFMDMY